MSGIAASSGSTDEAQVTSARRLKYASRDNSSLNARSANQNSFVVGECVPGIDEAAAIATAEPTDRSRVNAPSALPLHGYTVPEDTSSPRYFQNVIPWDTLLPIRLAEVQGFGVSAHCLGPIAKYRPRKSRSTQYHSRRDAVDG